MAVELLADPYETLQKEDHRVANALQYRRRLSLTNWSQFTYPHLAVIHMLDKLGM